MKNFLDLCTRRHSVRAYRSEPVPTETLSYVMECARLAPSAVNYQPWCFSLINDPAGVEALRAAYPREWFATAPVYILACKFPEVAWVRRCDGHNHADIDIAIAVEHLCLAAAEQGLGTCWVCNFDIDLLRERLTLPQGAVPSVIIPIGFPATDEIPSKLRKPLGDIWLG